MRFDKETRAKIREAAPGSVTIKWPAGQRQPEKGRAYRMQAVEDIEKAEQRLKDHPEKCRDAMAQMHFRRHGKWPKGYKPPRPKLRRPTADDDQILVLDVDTIGKHAWEAKVVLYEDADPIRHTGLKTRVAAGPNPIDGLPDPTELEPEKIVAPESRGEREDREDAFKLEHQVSVKSGELGRAEQKLVNQRRRGKRSKQAEEAVKRRKKRLAEVDAAASV